MKDKIEEPQEAVGSKPRYKRPELFDLSAKKTASGLVTFTPNEAVTYIPVS